MEECSCFVFLAANLISTTQQGIFVEGVGQVGVFS